MARISMSQKGLTPVYIRIIRRDPCSYCGGIGGTTEHIRPYCEFTRVNSTDEGMSRNHWSNLASSCRRCNFDRGNMGLLSFLLTKVKLQVNHESKAQSKGSR